jgi:DNA polymerase delta subunit 2
MNGLNFLGTSGQNIRDMLLNSITPELYDSDADDEGVKCLHRIKQTLEMRHLCPTAPDTLRIYPFHKSDPFVIDSPVKLELQEEDDEQEC